MKLVYIRWCDAIQNVSDAWKTKEVIEEWAVTSDWEVESVGWIVCEKKEYLVLCSKKQKDQWNEEQLGLLLKIPKTWIRERRYL